MHRIEVDVVTGVQKIVEWTAEEIAALPSPPPPPPAPPQKTLAELQAQLNDLQAQIAAQIAAMKQST
jgi:hypothetical protein